MITLLPYPNFAMSAHCFSSPELSRQRTICMYYLMVLSPEKETKASYNIVSQMWRGYEPALLKYMKCLNTEWLRRGFLDNYYVPQTEKLAKEMGYSDPQLVLGPYRPPPWLGWDQLHASHRQFLLDQDWEWYHQFCWKETPHITVIWPGPTPNPGDYLTHDDLVALVLETKSDSVIALIDGHEIEIPLTLIRRKYWQRAARR